VRKRYYLIMFVIVTGLILGTLFFGGCSSTPVTEPQGAPKEETAEQKPVEAPAKKVELSMAHFMSPKHVQQEQVMEPFVAEVKEKTGGMVDITIYPGAAMGKAADQYDNTMTGVIDIAYGLHGYTPGRFPMTSVMELPFMATSGEHGSMMLWELYNKFPEMKSEHPDVEVLWLWTHDVGQLLTTTKQVKTLEDMKGLKLRSPSATLNPMIEAWGATPVNMPISELFEAMQRGIVDGTIVPLSAVHDFNLDEVVKYATVGDFYVATFFMAMNENSFGKLSPGDQEIFKDMVGERMVKKAAAAYDAGSQRGIDALIRRNIPTYTLPESELAKWKEAVEPLVEEWIKDKESKGLPGRQVYDEAMVLKEKLR